MADREGTHQRVTVPRAAFGVIVAFAAWASFSASTGYARDHGADVAHIWAIPACLEALALSAAWRRLKDHRDVSALVVFWSAFVAAVAINVAHGHPSRVLMALYALPPAALVGGGHLLLRELHADRKSARPKSRRSRRTAHSRAAQRTTVRTPKRTSEPTRADTNGTPVRTRDVTLDELRDMFPTLAACEALKGDRTWQEAWESVGATLSQGNRLRAEHREHQRT